MSESLQPSEIVGRRRLLGRGAVVAGAAAASAVAIGVGGARPASAATGDALKQGGSYTGGSTTTLSGGSASTPALRLTNPAGPSLELTSVGEDFAGDLQPGQLLAIDDRVLVGAKDSIGGYTTAFATLDDLNSLPLPIAINPSRLVDTRTEAGRAGILAVGGTGLDANGKLKAGAWIDVLVDTATDDVTLTAAFLNLTSTQASTNGFLFAYPPGDRPTGSTTSYQKGVTTASSCLAALDVVKDSFAVRVYSSSPTHVIVDLTGLLVVAMPSQGAPQRVRKAARRSVARRAQTWKPARRR